MMGIHSNRKALVNSWHFSIVGTYGIRTTDRRRKAEGKASTNIPRQLKVMRERGGSQTKSFKLDVCWENPISGRSRIYHIIVRKRKLVPGANAMRFSDQSSTAVASTLRLPAKNISKQ